MIFRAGFLLAAVLSGGALTSAASASIMEFTFDVDVTPTHLYEWPQGHHVFDENPNPKLRIDVAGSFTYDMDTLLETPIGWEPGFGLANVVVNLEPGSTYGGTEVSQMYASLTYRYIETIEENVLGFCLMSRDYYAATPGKIGCGINGGENEFLLLFDDYDDGLFAISAHEDLLGETIQDRNYNSFRNDEGEFSFSIIERPTDVPAPEAISLLGLGLIGLTMRRKRVSGA